jgi:FkbM family methyltransferase
MKDFIAYYFKGLYLFFLHYEYRVLFRLFLLNMFKKRHKEYTVSVDGYQLVIADFKSFIYQYEEIFYKKFYQFTSVSERPVIYDCGSNIGMSLLFFARHYPTAKIIGYEASASVYGVLAKNIEKNKATNVIAYQNAVWIKNEELTFSEEGADSGSLHSISNTPTIRVQAIDFLEVLNKEDKIDLLKMDIEGAETTILPHIVNVLHKIENMFIEYHSFNGEAQTLDQILSILQENKFRYYIRHVNDRKTPFINLAKDKNMDMQLNIFAYKMK